MDTRGVSHQWASPFIAPIWTPMTIPHGSRQEDRSTETAADSACEQIASCKMPIQHERQKLAGILVFASHASTHQIVLKNDVSDFLPF